MRGFEYKVAHIVEGHVLAKRYLTGTDKSYNDQLSSVRIQESLVDVVVGQPSLSSYSLNAVVPAPHRGANALWRSKAAR
jgi:hypothetical protein|eukprot:COSAG02_NODE_8768_length_2451_cov_2.406463_2_plen_79_part_00